MRNTRLPEVLHYQLLLREPLVAVVPEGHPLAETPGGALRFQHLAQEPFVFFSREVGTALYDEILLLLGKAGITPYITQKWGSDDHHRAGLRRVRCRFCRPHLPGCGWTACAICRWRSPTPPPKCGWCITAGGR